jgi:putative SOS response-associated peptidase YedK
LYRRLLRPGEEKRMPILLAPRDYDAWLTCAVQDGLF